MCNHLCLLRKYLYYFFQAMWTYELAALMHWAARLAFVLAAGFVKRELRKIVKEDVLKVCGIVSLYEGGDLLCVQSRRPHHFNFNSEVIDTSKHSYTTSTSKCANLSRNTCSRCGFVTNVDDLLRVHCAIFMHTTCFEHWTFLKHRPAQIVKENVLKV